MGLYEAAKDALKVAQQADNVELVQKLLDVQKMALDMQEQLQNKNIEIAELRKENEGLKTQGGLEIVAGADWLIDPNHPDRRYCPTCYYRDGFRNPLKTDDDQPGYVYCQACKFHRS